jgi:tetratricopeptide (TPR) repeat protein
LRATLDWSHNLLSEDERILLRRLCVFADSWNLDAATAVCAMGQIKERDILELLLNLADKSLVSVDEQEGKARYRFLESIREYAREKLDEAGEEADIQQRHVEFFQALAERAEEKFRSRDQLLWLDIMEAERANFRAAIDYALHSPAESASKLVGTAFWLWFFRGPWSEGQIWAEAALAHASVGITPSKAKVLLALGLLNFEQSDYAAAKGALEKSLVVWRQLEDKWWSAFVLDFLGLIVRARDEAAASAMFRESVELATATDEKWILAFSLWNMGENELHQKNLPEARRLLEKCLKQIEALGDRLLQNEVLRALGEIAEAEQDYAQAVSLYEQSLVIIREFRDTTNISVLHYDLGRASQLKGDNDRAASHFKEAMQWSQRVGKRAGTLRAIAGLGVVSAALGDAHKAVCLLVQVISKNATLGISSSFNPPPHQSGWLERHLAMARQKLGEEGFASAKAEGQTMTLDRAVKYALA